MKPKYQIVATVAMAAFAITAMAQKPVIYPAKGQTAKLQQRDEGECHVWAKGNTGVDPAALAAAPPAAPTGAAVGGGERARGAARGAVGGAAIGAIAGDTGKGAGIGAVAGTMAGGRQARQNQAAQGQQAQNAHSQQLDSYHRAYGACLEGRGYTVK